MARRSHPRGGFTVRDHVFGGEKNGDCSHATRCIRVEVSLAPAHRMKTLAHELAHALLHQDSDVERGLEELEAESAAFVVCHARGIRADDWTFGYVAAWRTSCKTGGDVAASCGLNIPSRPGSPRACFPCRPAC